MNAFLLLSTLNLSLGGLVFLLGFLILRENPGQRLNRVVALMLFFGGLGAVFAALSFMASRGGTTAAPGTLRDLSYVWELFFPTLFLFASIFPEERAFVRRPLLRIGRRWSVGFTPLLFVPHAFHFLFVLAASSWQPAAQSASHGPFHYLGALATLLGLVVKLFLYIHRALFSLVNLGFGLATMALLFDSYRRARVPRLRQQIGVVAVGLSASLVLYSAASSIPTLLGLQLAEDLRASLTFAALTLGPGSIAYAVVRHKFLDAKLLARRGILYALSSAALVGLYLAVAARLTRALSVAAGTDVRVIESVMLIVALALSQPVVAWLEAMLDRAFLKDPGDYRNVLRRLAGELQTTIDLDALLGRTITHAHRGDAAARGARRGVRARRAHRPQRRRRAARRGGARADRAAAGARARGRGQLPRRGSGRGAGAGRPRVPRDAGDLAGGAAALARGPGGGAAAGREAHGHRAHLGGRRAARDAWPGRSRSPCRTRSCCGTGWPWRASRRSSTWRGRSSATRCSRSSRRCRAARCTPSPCPRSTWAATSTTWCRPGTARGSSPSPTSRARACRPRCSPRCSRPRCARRRRASPRRRRSCATSTTSCTGARRSSSSPRSSWPGWTASGWSCRSRTPGTTGPCCCGRAASGASSSAAG